MTRAEVVAFKEHATKRRKNSQVKYLQLFNVIRVMEEYDESIIRERFQGEGFMNNLSHYKAYLYNNILDSLREAHKNDSTRLHALLEQIIILKDKGFYHHTPPLFKKAFQLANEIEDFLNHLKLIELRQEIAFSRLPYNEFVEEFEELRKEETEIRKKYINLSEYRYLLSQLLPLGERTLAQRKKIVDTVMNNPLMASADECLSTRAKVLFHSIENARNVALGNYREGQQSIQTIIGIYEAYPSLLIIHTELVRYLNACYNLGLLYSYDHDFDSLVEVINKLEAFGKTHKSSPVLLFERIYLLKLYHAYRTLDEERGSKIIEEIHEKFKDYSGRVHIKKEVEFHTFISVFHLCLDQPKKALRWINRIKNENVPPFRKDFHFFAWILFLIAHFDLGNLDVIESSLSSTKRYLKKHQKFGGLEASFLGFLYRYIRTKSPRERAENLVRFQSELETVLKDPLNSRINSLFDLKSWVKAKISDTPLSQVLREELGSV